MTAADQPTQPTSKHTSIDFGHFARVPLTHAPTPIEDMPRLSEALGGPTLFIKRDDCTGLASGGNKTRKLEFLVGEALAQGADTLVTQGAVQSNHVRQTAAAACKLGLACHGLLERRVPDRDPSYDITGNVFFDRLFGATLEFRPPGLDMNAEAQTVADRLAETGKRPYFIPGGGSNAVGALGYAVCAQEIVDHMAATGVAFDAIVTASGSAGTHAGLVAGLDALGCETPVIGISVRHPRDRQIATVHDLANRTRAKLGGGDVPVERIQVDDAYVGAGYGIPAETTIEAIDLAARREGLLLDPVYSGKGLAGLIGLIRQAMFPDNARVLFLHTGGSAALFAYEGELAGNGRHTPRS